MWAMMAAPLIAGNDLQHMSAETRALLTDRDLIAVDQDTLGVQGFAYRTTPDGVEVWFKPLAGGDWAMAVLNRATEPRRVHFDWRHEGVNDNLSKQAADFGRTTYRVRDLVAKRDLGTTASALSTTVPAHDVLVARLRRM